MNDYLCKKCGGNMSAGKALAQTFVGGTPDFECDIHPITFCAGGTGMVIDCIKCEDCGWSTITQDES